MNATPSRPKGLFLSLRQLLLITSTLLFTVILAAIFYWFYAFATRQAMAQVKQGLLQALETAASKLVQAL
jgi:hypothetical protein